MSYITPTLLCYGIILLPEPEEQYWYCARNGTMWVCNVRKTDMRWNIKGYPKRHFVLPITSNFPICDRCNTFANEHLHAFFLTRGRLQGCVSLRDGLVRLVLALYLWENHCYLTMKAWCIRKAAERSGWTGLVGHDSKTRKITSCSLYFNCNITTTQNFIISSDLNDICK